MIVRNWMQHNPTLVDGELRLTQSLAIVEYLDEVHPTPALLPVSPAARASLVCMSRQ